MKNMKSKTMLITAATLLTLSAITGCGATTSASRNVTQTTDTASTAAVGTVLLSVNPEIEVEYDKAGKVVRLEGINDDGQGIVSQYADYTGKDCSAVVDDLVDDIYENGYLENQLDGKEKNIIVKLEKGSELPDDTFLDDISNSVQQAVASNQGTSAVVPVKTDDLDDSGLISLEAAKKIVLAQVGLDEATFTNREYKLDDHIYEFEFTANGIEYEYEVNAYNGKVLEADYESNDDWKDMDDANDDQDDSFDDDTNDDQNDSFDDDGFDDDTNDDWDDDYDDAADDNWDDGYDDAADDSRDDGYDDAADDSWDDGYDDAADDSWDDGYDDAADDSWDDGYDDDSYDDAADDDYDEVSDDDGDDD
ncbi:MAG: hypothetical protein EOM34_06560 [Clostridia bacterium]|nr:PepSY domain-containing protein [Lachnospiraceae bacterium]NCC00326.1 hypothetical protein [Clostridia bacterium]NCD02982.1 hypothetical protein [Clostridia bacterium]